MYRFAISMCVLSALATALPGAEVVVFSANPALAEVPASPLRSQLAALPDAPRAKALAHLATVPVIDAQSLNVSSGGELWYKCVIPANKTGFAPTTLGSSTQGASVSINNPPKKHSKPGSSQVIYLDFTGATVSGTAWNASENVPSWTAKPYSTDADFTTFSDAEQAAIVIIWERVSEDYAPFDVDVTTEAPSSMGPKTAWALITTDVDANGKKLPHFGAGGVAYVGKFGATDFQTYSPAWVLDYNSPDPGATKAIGDAASHEVGHNLGLRHDGNATQGYEGGFSASSTAPSWGPIMGAPYDQQLSQWCKGDYIGANNQEDDLAIIAQNMPYRTNDNGGVSSPQGVTLSNKVFSTAGFIGRTGEIDAFRITLGEGPMTAVAKTYRTTGGTDGGNLDIKLSLLTAKGVVVATDNPPAAADASISTTVSAGTYILTIEPSGAGNPTSARNGYTNYGSLGQYTLTGTGVTSTGGNGNVGGNGGGSANNNSGGAGTEIPGPTYDGASNDSGSGGCGLGSGMGVMLAGLFLLRLRLRRS